jgi:hypothetical protein
LGLAERAVLFDSLADPAPAAGLSNSANVGLLAPRRVTNDVTAGISR